MGLLNNSSLTVDAVLTKKGREKLSQNSFNVTKFALGDDEIDYSLWNTAHPSGSAYYGKVIENMPVNEATMYTTIQNKIKRRTTDIIQTALTVNGSSGGSTLQVAFTQASARGPVVDDRAEIYMFPIVSTITENFSAVLEIPDDVTSTNDDILSNHVYLLDNPWVTGNFYGTKAQYLSRNAQQELNESLRVGGVDQLKKMNRQTANIQSGFGNVVLAVFGNELIAQYGAKSFTSNFVSLTVTGNTSGTKVTYPVQFTFNTA